MPDTVPCPSRRAVLAGAASLALGPARAGISAEMASPLGTARTLAVGTQGGLAVGLKSYPRTLDLADGEVVLTFDDGPWPGTTERVLDALGRDSVRATFFMVGRNAAAHPGLVRRVAADGHTVANHTYSHAMLRRLAPRAAEIEVDRGFDALRAALGREPAPFFRYPGFADTATVNAWLASRGIGVFGCDLWASDWTPMTPRAQHDLVMRRLEAARRGIILFHDTHAQTAQMIPDFLASLRRGGFRVVHLVPGAGTAVTTAAPDGWSSDVERMIALAQGQRMR